MKFTIGPKITPAADTRVNDENHLYGTGWVAVRTPEGCTLSRDGGELMSQDVTVAISEEEFERLRAEPAAFYDIAVEHDPNAGPRD